MESLRSAAQALRTFGKGRLAKDEIRIIDDLSMALDDLDDRVTAIEHILKAVADRLGIKPENISGSALPPIYRHIRQILS